MEVSIGGKKYCASSIGESTYSTAEAKCRSRNAKLPMPRSSKENSDFMYVLSKLGLDPTHETGNPVILGMVDSAVGSVIGKDWYDNDGKKLTYLNWEPGQPNHAQAPQDYASIKTKAGQ